MDAPRGYREPTFGQRLLARLVDGLVLLPLVALMGLGLDGRARAGVVLLVGAAYEIGLVARDGRTLGKRALGLRIMAVADGALPTPRQAGWRWLVPAAGSLVALLLPGLGALTGLVPLAVYLPILHGPLHRGLHDRVAGTIVSAGA
jgi:uncharacterized RDD family membrane protein YckC